ncbi:DEP domain-containing protein 1A-like [Hetaerina americana]|uniref:DEP domain-containing protein 1A-like n=1 Tax=Hetaerina americana TaxID=62018 RepID=UPI003A7F4C11
MDIDKYPAPYRATKLWNEAICLFRNGMPLKRHRKHIKLHDNCFSGGEAVSWLHSTLKDDENFGQDVTREKTFQLLSKFLKVGVFQCVNSGNADSKEAFKENELYRFCCRSPLRNIQLSTLASLSSQHPPADKGVTRSTSRCTLSHKLPKRSPSFQFNYLEEIKSRAASNQLKQMEIEEVWKTVVLGRLQALLGALSVDDLLPSNQTSGARIMKNANFINGLASYHSFNRSQLFPRWILAAMKSLINWPHLNRSASSFIWYPGFEVDVFKVIKDYFSNLESPLITSFLYSAFINSYAYVEYVESLQEFDECASTDAEYQGMSCGLPSKSQENLVLNMTTSSDLRNKICQSEPLYCPLKVREIVNSFNESFSDNCGASRMELSRIHSVGNSNPAAYSDKNEVPPCNGEYQFYSARKLLSSPLPPNACFETAFTSDSPVTRIIPRKEVENIHLTHRNRQRESFCQRAICSVPHPSNKQAASPHHKSLDVLCNIRRNSSAPNLIDISSTNDESSNYTTTNYAEKGDLHDHHHNKSLVHGEAQLNNSSSHIFGNATSHPTNCTPACSKVKLKKSHGHNNVQRRSTRRKKSPSESGLNEKLHHIRNKSGGYVNVALSSSVDELDQSCGFDHLLGEDLDYDKALDTLHKLIKCTYRGGESESFSEVKVQSDACGNQSCSSTSSLWSYHTAASGEQSCSSDVLAATSRFVMDCRSSNPTAEELMNTGIQTVQGQQLGLDIFQLLLLLLPPVNRYKLHVLLYFMSNIISNGKLVLQDGICTKSLLLDTFTPSILRPEANVKGDEGLARRLISFFLDNHQALFQVSPGLQSEVNSHLLQLPKQVELSGPGGAPMAYCERISCQQYEEQKLTGSRLALVELLDQIIMDEKMGSKEKKKRLKMFREAYPHIYHMRFPCHKKEDERQSKSRGILGFASLTRLRNLRI